jgi:hypothetical protein
MDLNRNCIRVLLNHTLQMLLHYNTHKVFTSHFKSSQDDCSQLATHELPAAVSHRELTDHYYSRTSFSLCYKPLIWHAGKSSNFASLLKCLTSLLTRSRDPSPLLRRSSVHSCCLATNEARRCEEMRDSSWLSWARHGTARRKLRFVSCCVIVGVCFDVTVPAWHKYATVLPP